MKKKKVNPRRIPLSKSAVDKNAILEEATKDDMYRAWLLVVNALLNLELVPVNEIDHLADSINRYISSNAFKAKTRDSEMARAEEIMGMKTYSNLNPDHIKSPVQLEVFKKKVYQVATHTALCILCLGLEHQLPSIDLNRLFLNVKLTMAEIDAGITTYDSLEADIGSLVFIDVDEDGDSSKIIARCK